MNYQPWVDLFGKAADDSAVRSAVAKAGITKPLRIGRDELTVGADVPDTGMHIVFTDESIMNPSSGLLGRPILSSVLMILQHPKKPKLYTGPLPYQLKKETSQEAMRARFGKPVESDDDMRWDTWLVDGLKLTVCFTSDLQSIDRLTVKLPTSR
jgi:hypothetical protein